MYHILYRRCDSVFQSESLEEIVEWLSSHNAVNDLDYEVEWIV